MTLRTPQSPSTTLLPPINRRARVQVKLRMDFTAITVGTFLYHCHILGHEDGGMMAQVCVER